MLYCPKFKMLILKSKINPWLKCHFLILKELYTIFSIYLFYSVDHCRENN